jgi:hypothetical protein
MSTASSGQLTNPGDSLKTGKEERFHSPRKATILSAVLPGAGQAYNRKYWKMPIVYAGMGTAAYFIYFNNQQFQLYKDALIADLDGDPNTVNTIGFTTSQLDQLQETYRRWRDLSWFALAGVYVLQIIDANVDAYLFYYDVSDDLSLRILPSAVMAARPNAGLTLTLKF